MAVSRELSAGKTRVQSPKRGALFATVLAPIAALSLVLSPMAGATDETTPETSAPADPLVTQSEVESVVEETTIGEEPSTDAEDVEQDSATTSLDEGDRSNVESSVDTDVRAARNARDTRAVPVEKFDCSPGTVYTMDSAGYLREYKNGSWGISSFNGYPWLQSDWEKSHDANTIVTRADLWKGHFNSLGISPDGSFGWALHKDEDAGALRFYRFAEGKWINYGLMPLTYNNQWKTIQGVPTNTNSFVAGAVDNEGRYFFGGPAIDKKTKNLRFVLYMFDGRSYYDLGYMDEEVYHGYPRPGYTWPLNVKNNGDMAFSPNGDLFIVNADSATDNVQSVPYSIITIRKERLDALIAQRKAQGLNGPPRRITEEETTTTNVRYFQRAKQPNGIAFRSDGSIYIGDLSTLYIANPITAEAGDSRQIPPRRYPGTDWFYQGGFYYTRNVPNATVAGSTDLASCGSFPTLMVEKIVEGTRASENDEFELKLQIDGSNEIIKLTKGRAPEESTLAAPVIGPIPVKVGSSVLISEGLKRGDTSTEIGDDYISRWECFVGGEDKPRWSGNGSAGTPFTVPSNMTNGSIVCRFFNSAKPKESTVTVNKLVKGLDNVPVPASGWDMTLSFDGEQSDSGVAFAVGDSKDGKSSTKATEGENGSTSWTLTHANNSSQAQMVVSETSKPGFEFESLECIKSKGEAQKTVIYKASENPSQTVFALPDPVEADSTTVCTFVNKQKPGSVTWNKVDPNGEALDGSEWKLVGPTGDSSDKRVVEDCVGDSESACADKLDKNPAAGAFKILGLPWGTYTLTETVAPTGFKLDTTPHKFTIGPDAEGGLDQALDPITNQYQDVPALPLTGGLGSHLFLIVGGLVGGAGVVASLFAWRRRRLAVARH